MSPRKMLSRHCSYIRKEHQAVMLAPFTSTLCALTAIATCLFLALICSDATASFVQSTLVELEPSAAEFVAKPLL